MKRTDYVQSVALIKMQEKKLFTTAKLNRMIDVQTASELFKLLSESDYSQSMLGVVKEEDYEKILIAETIKTYQFAKNLAKNNQDIVNLLSLKYDYQNLKLKIKNIIKPNKEEPEYIELDTNIKLDNVYNLAMKEYEKTKDIQLVNILIDKMYFNHINMISNELAYDVFIKYTKLLIDEYNIVALLRMKASKKFYEYAENVFADNGNISKVELLYLYEKENYIEELKKLTNMKKEWEEYQKNKNIAIIEKKLSNNIIQLMMQYRNINYGPEPIFTYVLAKEYEMKAIRLIMTAKINKLDNTTIRERIRDIYV